MEMLPEEEEPMEIVLSLPTTESVKAVAINPGLWPSQQMELSENKRLDLQHVCTR